MKMTLEQLAEKIDALSNRMDKMETKVDDLATVINKSKGIIGFIAWAGGISAIIIGYFYQR